MVKQKMISLLSKTLSKTTKNLISIIGSKKNKFDKNSIEEFLIECDVDYDLVEKILDSLPAFVGRSDLSAALHNALSLTKIKSCAESKLDSKPMVTLIVGINGAGKTTTIAKLGYQALQNNKSVMFAAGDTFRAAATQQLQLWGEKLKIPVISTQHMHDPSALAFDSIKSAIAKSIDCLFIDTAGRLHTNSNLNNELLKIIRICNKALDSKPFNIYLVLDGTQGSGAIAQAKAFSQHINFDGIIMTKLDGTSKGGAIFSIVSELQIPVLYIGVGEKETDLIHFNSNEYINILLDSIFEKE